MKAKLAFLATIVALSSVMVGSATASITVGSTINLRAGMDYRAGNGGEFQVLTHPGNANLFHTFCADLEDNLKGTNYVEGIGFETTSDGTTRTLSLATAKLFEDYTAAMAARDNGFQGVTGSNYAAGGASNFLLGGGYTFDMTDKDTRALSGQEVQSALWRMMGWSSGITTANVTALMTYYQATYGLGLADASNTRARILNLRGDSTPGAEYTQDMFYVIPEPGSFLVWGVLGLAGIGLTNRRRQS